VVNHSKLETVYFWRYKALLKLSIFGVTALLFSLVMVNNSLKLLIVIPIAETHILRSTQD
jgi:hypothetical protein